jgi:hypothetical protein
MLLVVVNCVVPLTPGTLTALPFRGLRAEPKGSNPRSHATSGVLWAQALRRRQQGKVVKLAINAEAA